MYRYFPSRDELVKINQEVMEEVSANIKKYAPNSIVVVDETTQSSKYLRGGIVAKKHPLMDGLNWQSLHSPTTVSLGHLPGDTFDRMTRLLGRYAARRPIGRRLIVGLSQEFGKLGIRHFTLIEPIFCKLNLLRGRMLII